MLKHLLAYNLAFASLNCMAQIPHDQPDHPKGSTATQMQALPFYNEACELYSNGKIEKAKRSLYESINTSFALTESHLFLADIFYEQGVIDSAFYFYNSGIDFVIEQKPHYYFYLFETGIKLGQYDLVKHNLKHFNKLYGDKTSLEPYEEDYAFNYRNYEIYKAQIDELYKPKLWIPRANLIKNIDASGIVRTSNKNLFAIKNGSLVKTRTKRGKTKYKKIKGAPKDMIHPFLSKDGTILIFGLGNDTEAALYYSIKKGSKFTAATKLTKEVNQSNWVGDPFLTSDNTQLYFSCNIEGNKDLYLAEVNLKHNTAQPAIELERINTENDEVSPFFDEASKTFYFSSNMQSGFGGFDVYYSFDYETIKGIVFPFNANNLGSPMNSHLNEISIGFYRQNLLIKKHGDHFFSEYELVKPSSIDYDIRFIKINDDVD